MSHTAYRITHWDEHHEPAARDARGAGPLGFVKLRVFGHKLGGGYRRLMANPGGVAAFGLFAKVLELAADEPRERRNGTIYDHYGEPATAEEIAFSTLFPLEVVTWSLEFLASPAIGWLTAFNPADVQQCAAVRAGASSPVQKVRLDEDRDRDLDRDKDLDVDKDREAPAKPKAFAPEGVSGSVLGEARPARPPGTKTANALYGKLGEILGASHDTDQGDSDCTCLKDAAKQLFASGKAIDAIKDAWSVAASYRVKNKMAVFLSRAKVLGYLPSGTTVPRGTKRKAK